MIREMFINCANADGKDEQVEMEQKPPPWFGYKQVEEAPYPMTAEEHYRWPREPGYKYELHDGMCVRLWRGPHGYCGGYGILWAYQPATSIYRIIVPELPGCEMERPYTGDDDMENWNRNLEVGGEMVYRWMAAAWKAATTSERISAPTVPLPHVLEEPPEAPPLVHLKRYGVIPLETTADVDLAVAVLFALVDRIDGDKTHPLTGITDALAHEVEAYEASSKELKALWEEGIQSGPGRFANLDALLQEARRRSQADHAPEEHEANHGS